MGFGAPYLVMEILSVPSILIEVIGDFCEPTWIGDGFCDDPTNNNECNYDGGDCCGSDINTQVERHLNPGLCNPKLQSRTFEPQTFQP